MEEKAMRARIDHWNDRLLFGTVTLFAAGLASGFAIVHLMPQ